jgi:hypothetical protein
LDRRNGIVAVGILLLGRRRTVSLVLKEGRHRGVGKEERSRAAEERRKKGL